MYRGEDARRDQRGSPKVAPSGPGSPSCLAVPLKQAEYTDIASPITTYIFTHYAYRVDRDAELTQHLRELQLLRTNAISGRGDPAEVRGNLIRYYQALTVLQQHFPFGGSQSDSVKVTFTWADAFQPTKKGSSDSLGFEQSAVLFNLGAFISQQALLNDLSTGGGIKAAARQFQEAAGNFKYLHDVVSPRSGSAPTNDLQSDTTQMLQLLMLAQAQECYFLKASSDNKQAGVLSRLAYQVSKFYDEIQNLEGATQLRKYLGKVWSAHVSVKQLLFAAVAHQYEAESQLAADECGNALACLQEAQRLVAKAKDAAGGSGWGSSTVDQELAHSVDYYQSAIERALEKANKENASLYFQRIPSSPPQLQAASLVNPIPPEGLSPASDIDQWFAKLDSLSPAMGAFQQASNTPLPNIDDGFGRQDSGRASSSSSRSGKTGAGLAAGLGRFALGTAAKLAERAFDELSKPGKIDPDSSGTGGTGGTYTSSLGTNRYRSLREEDYERLADGIIRESLQAMQQAEDSKRDVLKRWRLPESLNYLKGDRSKAVTPYVMQEQKQQLQGGVKYLGQLFRQLQELRMGTQQELDRAEEELDQQQRQMGRSTRAGYDAAVAEFRDALAGYRGNLRDAMRQDEKVDRKIEQNQQNFEALDFNVAAAQGGRGSSAASAFVSTIRGALDSLDQLSAERSNLEKAFKWEWENDDVLKNRAQAPAYDPEAPYREGVRRYEEVRRAVQENLRKQDEVLRGINANMRIFGDLLQQSTSANQAAEQQFQQVLRDYNETRDNLAEGLGFYTQLQDAVKKLHQEVGDYCLARYLESTNDGRGSRSDHPGRWLFGRGARWSALPLQTCMGRLGGPPPLHMGYRRQLGHLPSAATRMHHARHNMCPRVNASSRCALMA